MSFRHSGQRVARRGAAGFSMAVNQISLAMSSGMSRRNWLKFSDSPPQFLHRHEMPVACLPPFRGRSQRGQVGCIKLPDDACQNSQGDGNISQENKQRVQFPKEVDRLPRPGRGNSQRLEGAGEAMTQVQAEQAHAEYVENGCGDPVESVHDHLVNIVVPTGQKITCVGDIAVSVHGPPGVVHEVINDEAENDQSGQNHGAGGAGGASGGTGAVGFGARRAIGPHELDGGYDMQHHTDQQSDARDPKQPSHAVQPFGVIVDGCGALKYKQIAHQVPGQE